jgi:hypothetical protein
VLDSATKVDRPGDAFQLAEIYRRLTDDVWSELARGHSVVHDIRPERRELQRSHVNRLVAALLRTTPTVRADARGLLRQQARALLARLEAAQARRAGRAGMTDSETGVHLADSVDSLRQALTAPLQRQGL